MTLAQILADVERHAHLPAAKHQEFWYVVAEIKGWTYTDLLVHLGDQADPDDLQRLQSIADALSRGIPAEYLLGYAIFDGIPVVLEQEVFVPRPETEGLVVLASRFLEQLEPQEAYGADVCSGSGAIALALAHRFPHLFMTGLELDERSVGCARRSARSLGVFDRVCFFQANVLSASGWSSLLRPVDLVVSNPPYVRGARFAEAHAASPAEPMRALYGGAAGLIFYRRILAEARRLLRPGGLLLFEIDDGLEVAILNLFSRYGMVEGRWLPDMNGLPRYAEARQAQ